MNDLSHLKEKLELIKRDVPYTYAEMASAMSMHVRTLERFLKGTGPLKPSNERAIKSFVDQHAASYQKKLTSCEHHSCNTGEL